MSSLKSEWETKTQLLLTQIAHEATGYHVNIFALVDPTLAMVDRPSGRDFNDCHEPRPGLDSLRGAMEIVTILQVRADALQVS